MQTSTYSPGGPDRLSDDDLSAVKSEYGLHSYDTPPTDTPLSWMSEDEIRSIINQGVFCFTRDGRHFAGIVLGDEVVYLSIDYTPDDVKDADALLREGTRNTLITNGLPITSITTMTVRRMVEADVDGITSLHTANGNEYRRWLEVAKLFVRSFAILNNYSISRTFKLANKTNWQKSVKKGMARGKHMPNGIRREELFVIFAVNELRKIGDGPSILNPINYELLIQQTEEPMSATNTVNPKQQEMKVVGHIDLDNVCNSTRPIKIDELEEKLKSMQSRETSLNQRITNLRDKAVAVENKYPKPLEPSVPVPTPEVKAQLKKRVKGLSDYTCFVDKGILAFHYVTANGKQCEGVMIFRNYNRELGYYLAFNINGDNKNVRLGDKDENGNEYGSIVERMKLSRPNAAERMLGEALLAQIEQEIEAYHNSCILQYEATMNERQEKINADISTINEEVNSLVEELGKLTKKRADVEQRIKSMKAERERQKAAWKERDAKEKAAKKAAQSAIVPDDSSSVSILQADEAVRAYAESPYPSVKDDDYADFVDPDAELDSSTFDQSAIEAAAAEGESYDIVIRSLQNLPFIHHLRGKRITYGSEFPSIADVVTFNSVLDEYAPFIAVAELTKLIAAARTNNTHTCYITKSYLSKMAEHANGEIVKNLSLLDSVPDGERFTGSFICPVDGKGGHHIYIFDIRRDDGTPRYRIAHLYDSELLGTANYMYRGQFSKPYSMETYLPSEHIQVEVDEGNRWRRAQAKLDENIVRAFVSMETMSEGIVKHELNEGRGEEATTELKHGDFPNDIEIRDASWYTSVFVDKEIPVRGHTRRYWCGSGPDRHLEVRTIMPFTRSGYHREAKNVQ